jgi:site-specific recombinase XerD
MTDADARPCKRTSVEAFVGLLGLPSAFLELRIRGLAKIVSSDAVTPKNKELIFRFLSHIAPEVSEQRLTFYTHKLRRLATWLQKDFAAADEEQLRALLTLVSRGNAREHGGCYAPGSVHGYQVTLKRFYRWLEGDDQEYPRKVRWIRTSGDMTRIREPEQLLTFEEVLEMIGRARSPRDKAMVSFLYESGARVGEMLAMRIRHLEFTPSVVRATLPVSKTRPRVIPLVSCAQHLVTWLNYHPLKNDPDAPLWSNLKGDGRAALAPQTVGDVLRAIAADAGIRKRVYPHLFRACSVTHKHRKGWPEQAIKAFHGLSKDSKVMRHYVHLSYTDLEDIQMRTNGLESNAAKELARGIACPRCGKENPLYVERCACGLPTELKTTLGAADARSLEAEIAAQVERKVREFSESREACDGLMERFMSALVEKSRQSPELRQAIVEITEGVRENQPPVSGR